LLHSGGEIVALGDGLGSQNLAGHVIEQHLEKLAFLRGVDRKLELAVVDLEFVLDRLTLLFAGSQTLPQINLGGVQKLDERFLRCILVVCREGIATGETCQAGKSESYRAGRREHHHSSRHVFPPSVD
jgi:hypothetical protein